MTYDEYLKGANYHPKVEQGPVSVAYDHVIVGGMGGSALPANALRFLDPAFPVSVHRDYDLPEAGFNGALCIAISYSGNTAETLSFARAASERELPLAVITSGGELAAFAKDKHLPFVSVPNGLQPRDAILFQLQALLTILNHTNLIEALTKSTFDDTVVEGMALTLANELTNTLPVFYASRTNGFLAYVSKINCNETGKVPAYANVFPEMNHNEIQSFDAMAPELATGPLHLVLLRHKSDDARIARRMDVFAGFMHERNRTIHEVTLFGSTRSEMLLYGVHLAHILGRALAHVRGVDPDTIPLIEDFKKRL